MGCTNRLQYTQIRRNSMALPCSSNFPNCHSSWEIHLTNSDWYL